MTALSFYAFIFLVFIIIISTVAYFIEKRIERQRKDVLNIIGLFVKKSKLKRLKKLYNKAVDHFNSKNYSAALKNLKEITEIKLLQDEHKRKRTKR